MFLLQIRMGNAAMLSSADVARSLREVAERVERHAFTVSTHATRANQPIRDENGDTVGSWRYGP